MSPEISPEQKTLTWRQAGFAAAAVLLAAMVAVALVKSKPASQRRPKGKSATLVEVTTSTRRAETVVVDAGGTVVPARQVELRPRTQGVVVDLHRDFEPGGIAAAGATLLRIDASDYRLALTQAEANLQKAKAELQLELGNQAIARRERTLLRNTMPAATSSEEEDALLLRQPQLASAQATVAQARAAAERARLDLQRTSVRAPFDALIQERSVNLGSRVNEATPLGRLVGTQTWWIQVAIPTQDLRWLNVPRGPDTAGSRARIYLGERHSTAREPDASAFREGRVIRQTGSVEAQGRLAQVLIAVDDPLALQPENAGRLPMLLGAWVHVEIEGATLPNVTAIPRQWVHDGDKIYLKNPDGRLAIRKVSIVASDRERVLIDAGLSSSDQIITSDLAAPVEGMRLRTPDEGAGDGDDTTPATSRQEPPEVATSEANAPTPGPQALEPTRRTPRTQAQ
jgi:RND family efflux transporter MFP subunit